MELKTLSQLPSPPTSGLLGHVNALKKPNIHLQMLDWIEQYGDLFTLRLGLKKILIVAEPDLVKQILKERPDNYRRVKNIENVFDESELNGIFTAEGERWKHHRKLTEPSFKTGHLKQFFPQLNKITQRLQKRFAQLAKSGESIDLLAEFKRYTVDVTTWLSFGEDFNSIERGFSELEDSLQIIFPTINQRVKSPIPLWRIFPSKKDRQYDQALEQVSQHVSSYITKQQAKLKEHPELIERPENILQIMLIEQSKDPTLTDQDIIANAITFLLAGEDTTANTLTWISHLIAYNQSSLAPLLEEFNELDNRNELTWPLPRLNYLNAITYEAMRLKPVTPQLYLESNQDNEIAGYQVPKGTPIFVMLHANGFDPSLFESPQSFNPERWLGQQGSSFSKLQPFGGGARLCPGRALAMMEIKLGVHALFNQFDIEPLQKSEAVEEHFAFTMSPFGFKCKLTPRV